MAAHAQRARDASSESETSERTASDAHVKRPSEAAASRATGQRPDPQIARSPTGFGAAVNAGVHASSKQVLSRSPVIQRQHRGFRGRTSSAARIEALLAPGSPLWRQLNPDPSAAVNCPATAAALDTYLSSGEVRPAAGGSGLATYPFVSNPSWSAPTPNIANIRSTVSRERFVVVEGTRPHAWAETNHITDTHYFVIVNHRGAVYVVEPQGGMVSTDVAGYVRQQGFATYRYAQQRVEVGPPNDLDLNSDLPPGLGEP